jgi:ubiquitin carboxyl-terminal hydrolase 34
MWDLIYKLADTQSKRHIICSFINTYIEAGIPLWHATYRLDSYLLPDESYIDRSMWVQASSRLTGIHNLSNTCYMNSLVNQLFMNVEFRNFIYNVQVRDPDGSQNLLHHLQTLFGHLQFGNDRAAVPHELSQSIISFEGKPINIHVQMDVDEFFNLLFDRIESQLMDPNDQRRFRRLYGGMLCHTIKSSECPHVSSREEDFAAIQCDVRGKGNLEESLTSYVKGEIMDGGISDGMLTNAR